MIRGVSRYKDTEYAQFSVTDKNMNHLIGKSVLIKVYELDKYESHKPLSELLEDGD